MDTTAALWFRWLVVCCVLIAFLVTRAIRAVAWLVRPITGRIRPTPAAAAPTVVTVSGGRFVRTRA
jgi:hypothetical protein